MKMMKNRLEKKLQKLFPKKQPGFTLIEMVIVVAIIATLVLLISPNLLAQKDRADGRTKDAFETTLQTQVQLYHEDKGSYPKDFETMVTESYLTQKQADQAKAQQFTVEKVIEDKTKKQSGQ